MVKRVEEIILILICLWPLGPQKVSDYYDPFHNYHIPQNKNNKTQKN